MNNKGTKTNLNLSNCWFVNLLLCDLHTNDNNPEHILNNQTLRKILFVKTQILWMLKILSHYHILISKCFFIND